MKPINPDDMNYPEWLTDPDSDMECPEEDREYHKVASMGMEWEVVVHPGTWKGTYVAFCKRLPDAWVVEGRKEDCLKRIGEVIEFHCVMAGRSGRLFECLYEEHGFSFNEFKKIDRAVRGMIKNHLMDDLDELDRLRKSLGEHKQSQKYSIKHILPKLTDQKNRPFI